MDAIATLKLHGIEYEYLLIDYTPTDRTYRGWIMLNGGSPNLSLKEHINHRGLIPDEFDIELIKETHARNS